jgi:hypothetical protein
VPRLDAPVCNFDPDVHADVLTICTLRSWHDLGVGQCHVRRGPCGLVPVGVPKPDDQGPNGEFLVVGSRMGIGYGYTMVVSVFRCRTARRFVWHSRDSAGLHRLRCKHSAGLRCVIGRDSM